MCDTDGDGVPDKVIIGDRCPGSPGGPGDDDGPSGPADGPGVESTTLDTCTYPPGEVADHPWGEPGGGQSICLGGICQVDNQEFPEDIPTTGSPTVGLEVTNGLPYLVG